MLSANAAEALADGIRHKVKRPGVARSWQHATPLQAWGHHAVGGLVA
jgi:hypothetical protein